MKMKKIFAGVAALATVSALSVSASAADWSKASYADNDPATVSIVSHDENGVTFTATADGAQAKCRITLVDVLENPDDVSKIKSGSWKITYNGLSAFTGTEQGWLGGGTYVATGNSASVSLAPSNWAEDGTAIWDDSMTVEDTFKYLLPSSVPTDASAAEFVFMDWSGVNLVSNNITITVSDLKLFDEAGNEIAQKAYGASDAAAEETEAPAETEAAVEETEAAVEETEAPAETEAPVEEVVEEAPVADTTTDAAATGNAGVAAIAAVMAVAGAAAVVSKRK